MAALAPLPPPACARARAKGDACPRLSYASVAAYMVVSIANSDARQNESSSDARENAPQSDARQNAPQLDTRHTVPQPDTRYTVPHPDTRHPAPHSDAYRPSLAGEGPYTSVACVLRAWSLVDEAREWCRVGRAHAYTHVVALLSRDSPALERTLMMLERLPWHEANRERSTADNVGADANDADGDGDDEVARVVGRVYASSGHDASTYDESAFVTAATLACLWNAVDTLLAEMPALSAPQALALIHQRPLHYQRLGACSTRQRR